MQAITTKYLFATNSKGSRIKATCDAGSITIPYPHELSGMDVHAKAAMELCRKLGWTSMHGYDGDWVGGYTHGDSYAFVYVIGDRYNADMIGFGG